MAAAMVGEGDEPKQKPQRKSGRYKRGAKRNRGPDKRLSTRATAALNSQITSLDERVAELQKRCAKQEKHIADLTEEVKIERNIRLDYEAMLEELHGRNKVARRQLRGT